MRALTISVHGSLDELKLRDDIRIPDVPPGHVRVRIRAAALNHLDLFVVKGLPGVETPKPWILGADGAGDIDALADDVGQSTAVSVGDRVVINPGISDGTCEYCRAGEQSACVRFGILGEHKPGTLAEYVVVPARNVARIPETIPIELAAAFTLSTMTAWRMVVTRAAVTPEDEVLIWGIGGGVALAAMRIVKQIGARVWVTSSSDEKLARAAELGADEIINHRTTSVGTEVRSRTGKRGVTVVLDSVGSATWSQSLIALGRRGRLVTCGGTSGPMVETDVRRLFWNQWSLMGSTMGNDAEFATVVDELRDGRLLPIVDSIHDLDRARSAFERLAQGAQFGKIVIRVSGSAELPEALRNAREKMDIPVDEQAQAA
ncbi:MAG TPA: zinc-binding dehydrogenase [Gemmatimonadaceae bacterium]